jgi:Ser/Thr protein kinase RdoA (MazF antagonist)
MLTITPEHAASLIRQHWNLEGQLSSLPSYSDCNFKVQAEGRTYVFKIAAPTWHYADLDLENMALLHLEKHQTQLNLPRVQLAVTGQHLLPLEIEGNTCYMRLLSYVDGRIYAEVAKQHASSSLAQSLGAVLAQLSKGLRDFHHSNAERHQEWNLISLPYLVDEISKIENLDLRNIVALNFEFFCNQLPTWMKNLPMQVIHNDANDLNLIVNDVVPASVIAVIDFGDMCHSFRVADLAIACTYAMQFVADDSQTQLECVKQITQAYHAEYPLLAQEISALLPMIRARLCHSILMANRAHRAHPENPFILVSQKAVRSLIRSLQSIDHAEFSKQLQEQLLN